MDLHDDIYYQNLKINNELSDREIAIQILQEKYSIQYELLVLSHTNQIYSCFRFFYFFYVFITFVCPYYNLSDFSESDVSFIWNAYQNFLINVYPNKNYAVINLISNHFN